MRLRRLLDVQTAAVAALILAFAPPATGAEQARQRGAATCPPRRVSASYERSLARALGSGRDVLGERLLRLPGGPTYAAAAKLVPPLLFARTSKQRPLTTSGVYYVPSAEPAGPQGAGAPMLLLADGSEVRYGSVGGPRLAVRAGGEGFGACLRRLGPARLADGYLPILQTSYADSRGRHYRQEGFAARLPDGTTALYLDVAGGAARLVTRAGALSGSRPVLWTPRRSPRPRPIDDADYASARAAVVRYWQGRLAEGASIDVPEARVMNALRASLVQNLMLTWRYSIGNPYEEFSFPESLDGAQVLAEYGFDDVAQAIVRTSLTRRPVPYPAWKMGEKLLAAATIYRLSGDREFLETTRASLRRYVAALTRSQRADGLVAAERYSSDIPDRVLGLHAQATAWRGLHEMARVWDATGDRVTARRANATAGRLRAALRRAVARSVRRPADGSLFVPMRLLSDEPVYDVLPTTRDGSYWNLVAPYALASGILSSTQERAALRYLLTHGSRFLGVVRAGAFSLYGRSSSSSGLDQVYGLNAARFLAALDEPDLLVLSLYGQLAAALTRETFVSGEASSLSPIGGAYDRSMYLPPNSVGNAALLETLRLLLVNELPEGRGLQLAYATPRAWLAPGKRIAVERLPTGFGPLSYSLVSRARSLSGTISVPRIGGHALSLRLRLPLGARIGSVTVGGRPLRTFDPGSGTIDLTGRGNSLDLEVTLAR